MVIDLRAQLELHVPVDDDLWQLLVDDGHISEVESGAAGIDHLVTRVQRLRRVARPKPTGEPVGELTGPAELRQRAANRAEALAALLAFDAEEQERVIEFRREVLRGRVIKPERVGAWIERRSAGPEPPAPGAPARVLSYAIAGSQWVQHVAVTPDSELDRLCSLSEALASRYGWRPAQATTFVLTGLVPVVGPVRARVQRRWPVQAATRIVLEIDPTTTPREVADHYARVRATVLARRTRRINAKNLRLAIYAQGHQQGTWEQRMQGWNGLYPDEGYSQASNFQRDAAAAIERLLDPGFRD